MSSSILEELAWRGLVHDQSRDAEKVLASEKVVVYAGFDPTGASLHIGHLLPALGLARMQRAGHRPIALVGGGTGLIGDPSGKDSERQLMTTEEVEANVTRIRAQLERLLDFEAKDNAALLVNNADWLTTVPMVEFLREIGKHFTVNMMLAKDSVSRRIQSDDGISFTEFSYMLMQAYDFLELHDRHRCNMQIGGSDQWGNITAGMELIRRKRQAGANGVTFPLITDASGKKFGKSESGESIWLDPTMTSPYRFYQYWRNCDDQTVLNYLGYFTFLPREEIEVLRAAVAERPAERVAQKRLASEMTRMIDGDDGLARADAATQVLFGGDLASVSADVVLEVFDDAPSSELARDQLEGDGMSVVDLLAGTDLASSKGEARRLINGGGVSLNNEKVTDDKQVVRADQAVDGSLLVLRRGRKNYHLVRVV